MLEIPQIFFDVPYNGEHYPGAPSLKGLEGGANCQQYAYEMLRYFGLEVPDFRSDELWLDEKSTGVVETYEPLDLLLFNRTADPFAAHVAVYIGSGNVIHLSRRVGKPEICSIDELQLRPEYTVLIGGKRFKSAGAQSPLEVEGIDLGVTAQEIVDFIDEGRKSY